ncbi:MAG: bifunctional 23S rRNA (guanine(2069)-N(7))-methyltransferase RlmK/23S rRNA (guanine(2445)-N(2))-methyltransferase RlmL, partial [Rhodanobacteraceae bacterium]
IDWAEHLAPEATLAIDATGTSGSIVHSGFAAQKVKDAIADQVRERFGMRPTVQLERPDVRLTLRVHKGRATLSLDLSGEPLHRRGWRRGQGEAPLKENLAAAMRLRARWTEMYAQGGALVDPMCGSGTLLIEGALMAADVAAGLQRDYFGFLAWRGHNAALWQPLDAAARTRAREGLRTLRPCFFGADNAPLMIEIAKRNAQSAGVAGFVQLHKRDLAHLECPAGFEHGLLITNPPYGERMGARHELPELYYTLGERLREQFAGWRAAILVAEVETDTDDPARALALRPDKSYALFNGAIACKLLVCGISAREQIARERKPLSSGGGMVKNRIDKNLRHLKKWLARERVSCFRIYDADLPEYAAAIDIYRDNSGARTFLHVQEYAPPPTVDAQAARTRLRDLVHAAGDALGVPRERIALKVRSRGKGGVKYGRFDTRDETLIVEEGGLRFEVNLTDHLDTGLFLDHRNVRALLRELAPRRHFLNLFAYTGTASVYAASGDALDTTSV